MKEWIADVIGCICFALIGIAIWILVVAMFD